MTPYLMLYRLYLPITGIRLELSHPLQVFTKTMLRLLDRAATSVSLIDSKACSATIETDSPTPSLSQTQTPLLLLFSSLLHF